MVMVVVDTLGVVRKAEVVHGDTDPGLRRAAVEAALEQRRTPPMRHGKRTFERVVYPLVFRQGSGSIAGMLVPPWSLALGDTLTLCAWAVSSDTTHTRLGIFTGEDSTFSVAAEWEGQLIPDRPQSLRAPFVVARRERFRAGVFEVVDGERRLIDGWEFTPHAGDPHGWDRRSR